MSNSAQSKSNFENRQSVFLNAFNRVSSINFLSPLVYLFSFLGLLVWFGSIPKADFWADDFSHLVNFDKTLGDVTNTDGKLVINFFWFLGSYAFGSTSALPYLLVNMSVFIFSILILSRVAKSRQWGVHFVFYVCAMLFGTGCIYAFLLWSSNVVHLTSLLGFSAALLLQERARIEKSLPFTFILGFCLSIIWTFATLSNPLYIGFLILGAYFVHEQSENYDNHLRRSVFVKLAFLNLTLPTLSFLFISYPRVTKQEAYDQTGFDYIKDNFSFYFSEVLNSTAMVSLITILSSALFFLLFSEMRNLNFAPGVFVLTAFAVVFPILIQGEQRGIHYFSIPIILLLSGIFSVNFHSYEFLAKKMVLVISRVGIATLIILIASMGSWVRSWYLTTPFGQPITEIRKSIANSTGSGEVICVKLEMPDETRRYFIASMGGTSAFLLPPISASKVNFSHLDNCNQSSNTQVTIKLSKRGTYVVQN